MNTEEWLRREAQRNGNESQIGHSDFYQLMLECGGDHLWEALPHFLADPSHEIRSGALILAGTRRPESREAMLLIAPFMRDPHPLVRLTAYRQLLSFSLVEKEVKDLAFTIQDKEWTADDQMPCVMAIRILLKADFEKYGPEMIAKLELLHDLEFGDSMVTDLIEQTFKEYGRL